MRIAGTRHTTAQYVFAILLTMALCGLWHGAGWNFVLWGAMQGVAIIFALGWRRVLPSPPRLVGWAATIGFFLLSGVVFRTGNLDAAWHIYAGLATLPAPRLLGKAWIVGVAALLAFMLPSTQEIAERATVRPLAWVPATLGLVCLGILVQLGGNQSYDFIYFRF
jgi:hypothetical protein